MKRIGQIHGVKLYDIIRSEENIRQAVKAACKDHHKDPAVQQMKADPAPYIAIVKDILDRGDFHYGRFRQKRIFERGKWRDLAYTRTFPDRVVQHAVMQVVGPILLGTCTADTYAAREGMGIHKASVEVRKALRHDPEGTEWCLKMDVHHYFQSVDRDKLFAMIKRKIKCRRTLDLLHTMIYDCPWMGLLIGLYISQILSSFYLSQFDHWVKEKLRIKWYFRYADDLVMLFRGRMLAHQVATAVRAKLAEYGLKLNRKWQVFRTETRGLDFLGFVMRHLYAKLRKRVKLAYIKTCNAVVRSVRRSEGVTSHMLASLESRQSMAEWCDSNHLIRAHTDRAMLALEVGPEAIA